MKLIKTKISVQPLPIFLGLFLSALSGFKFVYDLANFELSFIFTNLIEIYSIYFLRSIEYIINIFGISLAEFTINIATGYIVFSIGIYRVYQVAYNLKIGKEKPSKISYLLIMIGFIPLYLLTLLSIIFIIFLTRLKKNDENNKKTSLLEVLSMGFGLMTVVIFIAVFLVCFFLVLNYAFI